VRAPLGAKSTIVESDDAARSTGPAVHGKAKASGLSDGVLEVTLTLKLDRLPENKP